MSSRRLKARSTWEVPLSSFTYRERSENQRSNGQREASQVALMRPSIAW